MLFKDSCNWSDLNFSWPTVCCGVYYLFTATLHADNYIQHNIYWQIAKRDNQSKQFIAKKLFSHCTVHHMWLHLSSFFQLEHCHKAAKLLLWISSKSLLSFVSSFAVGGSWKADSWGIYFSLAFFLVLDPKFSWSLHFQVLKDLSSWRWSHSWRSPPSQLARPSPPAGLCLVWWTQSCIVC